MSGSKTVALIDYGIGNLRSVEKALEAAGAQVQLTQDGQLISAAEKVVLPGVGAFGDGMAGLRERGLIGILKEIVERGIALLGICLGMQLLFEGSQEGGQHQGLGFLPGVVLRFAEPGVKVPHTGWNQILRLRRTALLQGIEGAPYAYFNHSFYCQARPRDILAYTDYGLRYPCMVGRGRVYGVQFHPEKSQEVGLAILRNFVEAG